MFLSKRRFQDHDGNQWQVVFKASDVTRTIDIMSKQIYILENCTHKLKLKLNQIKANH